jgi:carboxypeptidase PM20D1
MAHQDVVPADESTLDKWTHPPFSGEIAEGFVWGRGTLDIKCQLISVMEAVEFLLKNNYQPERTVLLAFGHDEEVLGTGAKAIVAHLKAKKIRLAAVLDEGSSIFDGIISGIKGYAANIGVAEKGYLSMKFTVNAAGGHSSIPKPETAIGILARAIDRLQSNPFPYKVRTVEPMFKGLLPAATPLLQVAFSNLWLLGGVVKRKLASDHQTAATIHTTTAPTIFKSGVKDNVLPSLAEAVVNFRILPGESIAEVSERIRRVIDDERVKFEPLRGNAWEASPVSPSDCPAYAHLASVVVDLFPGSVCAPYHMLGGSDARNYYAVSDNVYRFTPIVVTSTEVAAVHGINEKISLDALDILVVYFYHLIPRWASRDM